MASDDPYDGEPIHQVLSLKRMSNDGQERYRLLLSDGQYSESFSMLSRDLNNLVADGHLNENAIIKVQNYSFGTTPPKPNSTRFVGNSLSKFF